MEFKFLEFSYWRVFILMITLISGTPTYSQQVEIFDKTPFDAVSANESITKGNATVQGQTYAKAPNCMVNCKQYPPVGTIVWLFPYTDYFEDYVSYEKKHKGKQIRMTLEAYEQRIEAKTYGNGRFKFTGLKPGKYFIETILPYDGVTFQTVRTGSTNYYRGNTVIGSTANYGRQESTYKGSKYKSKIVEVKKDGQVITTNL